MRTEEKQNWPLIRKTAILYVSFQLILLNCNLNGVERNRKIKVQYRFQPMFSHYFLKLCVIWNWLAYEEADQNLDDFYDPEEADQADNEILAEVFNGFESDDCEDLASVADGNCGSSTNLVRPATRSLTRRLITIITVFGVGSGLVISLLPISLHSISLTQGPSFVGTNLQLRLNWK